MYENLSNVVQTMMTTQKSIIDFISKIGDRVHLWGYWFNWYVFSELVHKPDTSYIVGKLR